MCDEVCDEVCYSWNDVAVGSSTIYRQAQDDFHMYARSRKMREYYDLCESVAFSILEGKAANKREVWGFPIYIVAGHRGLFSLK
jgi:hypothetical protein